MDQFKPGAHLHVEPLEPPVVLEVAEEFLANAENVAIEPDEH